MGALDTWILIASWFVGLLHSLSVSQFLSIKYRLQQWLSSIGIGKVSGYIRHRRACMGSEVRSPGFLFQICHLLAVQPVSLSVKWDDGGTNGRGLMWRLSGSIYAKCLERTWHIVNTQKNQLQLYSVSNCLFRSKIGAVQKYELVFLPCMFS